MTSRRWLLKLLATGASIGPALTRTAAAAGIQPLRDHARACDITPQDLRLEWRAVPIGIDTRRPRITWTLSTDPQLRGVEQRACQVILASSEHAARSGHGDVWDSGVLDTGEFRVEPDHDLDLQSHTPYWCAARAWDEHGRTSSFTRPTRFLTGLMSPSDWRAAWISDAPDWRVPSGPPPAINHSPAAAPRRMPLFRRTLRIDRPLARAIVSV
ncbi:MAG: hypothetical protein KGJ72_09280, partial [Gammaproteobacteria bacterium]|nr:hypothetical protein [Gammaproteobacteria bacterium]